MARCDAKLIDSLLLGEELPAPRWNALREHLRDCRDCRDRYDRASLAERMLHGGPKALAVPSPVAIDRIGRAVLAGDAPKRRLTLPRWIVGLATLGAAAAMIPLVAFHHRAEPELVSRGTATDPREQAGLRAFCLKARDAASSALEVHPLTDGAGCSTADLLKLAYTNKAGYEDLFLVGVDEQYRVKWYEPRPPSGMSVPAQRAVDQPIGGAIKIGINHQPGLVRVFALFGHAPIEAREIEAAVDQLKQEGKPIRDISQLPLDGRDDVVQRSILLDVTGADK